MLENARALAGGETHVVVAGQQPGLLGGPLFTVYKAATAVRLANELSSLPGAPRVVPLFWNHSDDHDLDEVNRTFLVNGAQDVQRLRLDLSRVDPATFLERRMEYHKGIEEDFLSAYRVAGTVEHELRRGDSIWQLSHETYRVPSWLIRRYNPSSDLTKLIPGETLQIPVVESL